MAYKIGGKKLKNMEAVQKKSLRDRNIQNRVNSVRSKTAELVYLTRLYEHQMIPKGIPFGVTFKMSREIKNEGGGQTPTLVIYDW